MGGGVFRKLWLGNACAAPMKPGMACTGVALDRGEVSQGSRGSELVTAERLKGSMGESGSFTVPASIFS